MPSLSAAAIENRSALRDVMRLSLQAAACVSLLTLRAFAAETERQPNIVIIYADDMDDLLRWRTEKASVVLIFAGISLAYRNEPTARI
ncbi:MAG: hypothetical protein H0T47_00730 [Planctomycetaceae bacterium]|nr:hypothetical protein [Planctomycetaceae bacterium]